MHNFLVTYELNVNSLWPDFKGAVQRLFRLARLPPRNPGYGEDMAPGRPHRGRNQRREASAGHIQEDIIDA